MPASSRARASAAIALLTLGACGGVPPLTEAPDAVRVAELLAEGSGPNVAVTSDQDDDAALHPWMLPGDTTTVARQVIVAISGLPRWAVRGTGPRVIWATRTTRLLRFVDDVYVLLTPEGDSTRVEVRSASRVGQGDLGQNRRNIRELWNQVRRKR